MMQTEYLNGYVRRKQGEFIGNLKIEGIDLGEIVGGFYSDKNNRDYVWLRRTPVLEYDSNTRKFTKRIATPKFECYAFKSSKTNIAYEGQFFFLHFTYDLCCCWDDIIKDRLNIYVVRSESQPLIESINKRNNKYGRFI